MNGLKSILDSIDLPIKGSIADIRMALCKGRNAVVEAAPGAGKTTLIPLTLLDEPWLDGRRIIMLEPRRLAARAAAIRMAELIGEDVGATIGYRTRLDSSIGPSTRIEVVTEGILTRFLQSDQALEGIGLLIFDEFHERSINADLGLALSLESQSLLRDDIRILIMSATLDGEEVSALLGGAPVVKSMGKAYPVEVRYMSKTVGSGRAYTSTGPDFISRVAGAVWKALMEGTGSILVFLPGSGEIKRVAAALMEREIPADTVIIPLYGELSKEAQDQAIRPSPEGKRKVVLATSIAETSITIDGVRVVIDGGLKRVPRFSPSIGMSSLETVRVTKDSAEQRCGRAGRLGPGLCVRLWQETENSGLKDKSTPEIMEADLAPLALELSVWGAAPEKLNWLDPPPAGAMSQAKELLYHLGAIDKTGAATAHGRELARLALHPRLAHMVIKGRELGLGSIASSIAAFLTERDFVKTGLADRNQDIRHRLEVLSGDDSQGRVDIDRSALKRVRAAAAQIRRQLGIREKDEDSDKAGLLLAFAYPDRIAKRRGETEGRYLLANGRGALLPASALRQEYIVAASLDGGERESRVYLAAPLSLSDLEEYFKEDIEERDIVEWDQAQRCVSARRQKHFWELLLSDSQLQAPDTGKVLDAFINGVKLNGLNALPWERASQALRERVGFLNRISGETGKKFPDLSEGRLLADIKEWLGPWIDGMTRLEHLKKLDMKAIILSILTWEERETIERLAPMHIIVPSGSRIAIDYSGERPVLKVKLQELFGLDRTPAVAGHPVLLHLLSPAGRPVQVTNDLAGFWARSYQMVKKELKGRYPKHYWPDDPTQAEATKGVRRKK
ncbi:MAG TPA: ATP-dependent helicase HrpB [Deltaproteobacteria bacterium]|nr:MAG: ATP-dependent helicase HrpB [Deltaproteobacteria bacterium GWA2_55_82]OIJ73350.1 MAG: ATP-dependent helicase HrpB [Deltaproteobacteria bacterium GWC2_55_46]HBG45374.1 ATP-dependent helicase HrpB [Deltaproteobacteria bacterium]HCY10205.1 ATP-dependent helicase HrpB [Deltaproteobacteria bacterium]